MKQKSRQSNNLSSSTIWTGVIIALVVIAIGVGIRYASTPSTPSDQKQAQMKPKSNPPVLYNKEKNTQMLQILKDRPTLSAEDQAARAKLTTKSDDPVEENELFSLRYIPSRNQFLTEIRTIDINKSKEATVEWLREQGLSDEGICNLPVVFYLNYTVANNLRGMNVEFNPLPPTCE